MTNEALDHASPSRIRLADGDLGIEALCVYPEFSSLCSQVLFDALPSPEKFNTEFNFISSTLPIITIETVQFILKVHFLSHSHVDIQTSKVYINGSRRALSQEQLPNLRTFHDPYSHLFYFGVDIQASMLSVSYPVVLVLNTEPNKAGGCHIVTGYHRTYCKCKASALGACIHGVVALFLVLFFIRPENVRFPCSNEFTGVPCKWKENRRKGFIKLDVLQPLESHSFCVPSVHDLSRVKPKKKLPYSDPSLSLGPLDLLILLLISF